MKVNLSQVFVTLDGTPYKENGKEVTLGTMACTALQTPFEDEPKLSGDDKCHRGKLAMWLHGEASANISIEDVALIKKLIDKMATNLIVAQARDFLDPQDKQEVAVEAVEAD